LPFSTVKEFSKSVNIWRSYCKTSTARFWDTHHCTIQAATRRPRYSEWITRF